jgi:ubiquinone/menaquinone biosynthesis C-methylase UbiE
VAGKPSRADEQAALWNGGGGNAWVELNEVLDGMLAPLGEALLASVDVQADDHVLDVGCGTGATTVDVAGLLGPRGRGIGIDISAAMLAAARARAEQSGRAAHFVLGDAQTYPFEPAQFDAVISRMGVMFFDDPVEAFTNLHHAARPGAQLRFLAWRGPADNPFMTTAERAAAPLLPQLPARDPDAPGQFAFADAHRVENILSQSGWSEINIHGVDLPCGLAEDKLIGYVASMGPVGRILSQTDDKTRARVLDVVREAFDPFVHNTEVGYTAACWLVGASRA